MSDTLDTSLAPRPYRLGSGDTQYNSMVHTAEIVSTWKKHALMLLDAAAYIGARWRYRLWLLKIQLKVNIVYHSLQADLSQRIPFQMSFPHDKSKLHEKHAWHHIFCASKTHLTIHLT